MGTLESRSRRGGIVCVYLSHYTRPHKPVSMTNPAWRVTKRRVRSNVRNTPSNEEATPMVASSEQWVHLTMACTLYRRRPQRWEEEQESWNINMGEQGAYSTVKSREHQGYNPGDGGRCKQRLCENDHLIIGTPHVPSTADAIRVTMARGQ